MNHESFFIRELKVAQGEFRLFIPELEIQPGEILCVMGRSGSGKSTLLNAVAGFLPILSGSVWCDGKEVATLRAEKRKIALLFQKSALFPHLTVEQNLEFSLKVQRVPKKTRAEKTQAWLSILELNEFGASFPHQLSGGQAQRVALGRAFLSGFPAFLLDEPFSALDTSLRSHMRTLLRSCTTETQMSVLLVSHDPADIWELADRVVFLERGEVVSVRKAAELKNELGSLEKELLGLT